MGHSMGGLTINTYLGVNPHIADKLAGVIYSAPFFGMTEEAHLDPIRKVMLGPLEAVFGEFVLMCPLPMHKITKNLTYF